MENENMMQFCDLHTHSIFSDGTWTPEALIAEAQKRNLGAIALCDHNTIDGLPRFLAAAEGTDVEAIPGIEFSTQWRGIELHIIGLFIRPEKYESIRRAMRNQQWRKDDSNRELIRQLCRLGFPLDYEKMKAATPGGHINRAHIGAELTRLGFTDSIKEAFDTLLSEKMGYYHPPERMDSLECIRYIKELGAVAVLAHPLLTLEKELLLEFLPDAVEAGLDAMESRYVTYDEETTRTAMEIADMFGLLHSGGSDFHGDNKPSIFLGVGKGSLQVPMSILPLLRVRQRLCE